MSELRHTHFQLVPLQVHCGKRSAATSLFTLGVCVVLPPLLAEGRAGDQDCSNALHACVLAGLPLQVCNCVHVCVCLLLVHVCVCMCVLAGLPLQVCTCVHVCVLTPGACVCVCLYVCVSGPSSSGVHLCACVCAYSWCMCVCVFVCVC